MRPLEFKKISVSSLVKRPAEDHNVGADHDQQPCIELDLLHCFGEYAPSPPENSDRSDDWGQMDEKAARKKNKHKEERSLSLRHKGTNNSCSTTTATPSHDVIYGTRGKTLGVHPCSAMIQKPISSHDHGSSPNYLRSVLVHGCNGWPMIRAPIVLKPQQTMLPPPQHLFPAGDGLRFHPPVVSGLQPDIAQLAMYQGFLGRDLELGSMPITASTVSSSSRNNLHEGSSLGLDLSLKL